MTDLTLDARPARMVPGTSGRTARSEMPAVLTLRRCSASRPILRPGDVTGAIHAPHTILARLIRWLVRPGFSLHKLHHVRFTGCAARPLSNEG